MKQHTAHLLNLGRIKLLSDPGITLNLLRVQLPFGEESNLRSTKTQ